MRRSVFIALIAAVSFASLLAEAPKEHYLATVLFPSTAGDDSIQQLEIGIESYTPNSVMDDLGAVLGDGNNQDALLHKFGKLKRSGWVSMVGRPSYDVKVIREKKTANGREITLLSDRPISYWEATNSPVTQSYPYGLMKLTVNDKGEGKGVIYPVVRVKSIGPDEIKIDDYGVIPLQACSID